MSILMPYLTDAELTWTLQRQREEVLDSRSFGDPRSNEFQNSLLSALTELQERRRKDRVPA